MSSSSDLQAVAAQVLKATVPEDVFGDVRGTTEERLRAIRQVYRKAMVLVHPDRFTGNDEALANDCVQALGRWRTEAEAKVTAGTYGDRKPVVVDPPRPTMEPQVIKTPKGQYVVESLLTHGDLADIYRCSFAGKAGAKSDHAFKVVQSAADNDLLEHESKVLAALYPADPAMLERLGRDHNATGEWQGAFRAGALDLVATRYAINVVGGVDGLVITWADAVRDGGPVCTTYDGPRGTVYAIPVPQSLNEQASIAADLFKTRPMVRIIETKFPEAVAEMLDVSLELTSYGPTHLDKVARCPSTKS